MSIYKDTDVVRDAIAHIQYHGSEAEKKELVIVLVRAMRGFHADVFISGMAVVSKIDDGGRLMR